MDIEAIKDANDIVEIIGETVSLKKAGANFRGREDNSLYVWADSQTYKDFSDNGAQSQGDVITWVMRRLKCEFKEAIEWLCDRAKLARPHWKGESAQQVAATRARYDALTVAARHFVRCLRRVPEAMDYCRSRGWTDKTIRDAGLGYVDGDRNELVGELAMNGYREHHPAVKAVLGIPSGMLVYPHVMGGRVVYLSCRIASRTEKRHYNPKVEWIGERQPYYNWVWSPRAALVVVVEGQADAITLGQWGIAAVAMAGVSPGADLVTRLGRHKTVVLGLDQDGAGKKWTFPIADALGPMTRLVCWPAHDVNDWLTEGGGCEEECRAVIKWSDPYVLHAARQAGEAEGIDRGDRIKAVFRLVALMDDMDVAMLRDQLAKAMGIKLRPFNALLKAARGECQATETTEEESDIVLEIAIPGGYIAGHLLEMLVIPPVEGEGNGHGTQWKTRFAVRWPDGRIGEAAYVDVDRTRYVPISAHSRMLQERVVSFPSALGEALTLRELITLVQQTIHRYMDVDVFYEFLSTYYVLFTWLHDSFNTLPYLRLLGDAGTGKSRFLQVVGAMCYRPITVTGATTVSPVFRTLDVYRGTFCLDEADFRASDEAAEIIKILNTGYQRQQGIVLRSGDKNVGFETEIFVTYGPKIIGTRKRFQDWALESRCLTYETGGPTTRTDIPIDLPRRFFTQEAVAIRNKLLHFRMEHWQPEIELNYERAEIDSVEPRLRQVTVALLTLIDDDGLREDLQHFIQDYNRQLIVERGMTPVAKVLDALVGLQELSGTITLHFPLKELAKAANILIDVENEGEYKDDEEEEKGKGKKKLSPRGVGHIVRKQLHLRTERKGEGRAYVACWDHDRVEGLRKRYGVDDEWAKRTAGTLKAYLKPEQVPPGF